MHTWFTLPLSFMQKDMLEDGEVLHSMDVLCFTVWVRLNHVGEKQLQSEQFHNMGGAQSARSSAHRSRTWSSSYCLADVDRLEAVFKPF